MSINYNDARKELFDKLLSVWNNNALSIFGYIPVLYWEDIDYGASVEDSSVVRAHVNIKTISSRQATLSNLVGEIGKRRFETHGIFYVRIHGPKASPGFDNLIRQMSELIQIDFRNSSENCRLNNATIKELPMVDGCAHIFVAVDYYFHSCS